MYGQFNGRAPERWGVVHAKSKGWLLCVDDSGHISDSNKDGEPSIDLDGATLDQVRALRDLLNSGAIEQLLAAAVAWGRGDEAPPDDEAAIAAWVDRQSAA